MKPRCSHRDKHGYSLVDFVKASGEQATAFESHLTQHMRCRKCRDYVPFGHANDADERVQLEIRAASLAVSDRWGSEFTVIEWCGYSGDEVHSRGPFDLTDRGWQAG